MPSPIDTLRGELITAFGPVGVEGLRDMNFGDAAIAAAQNGVSVTDFVNGLNEQDVVNIHQKMVAAVAEATLSS